MSEKQSAVENIVDRVGTYKEEARSSANLSFGFRASSCVIAGVAVYNAMKGQAEIAALETALSLMALAVASDTAQEASAYENRAAILEGALAQHELANDTKTGLPQRLSSGTITIR